MAHVNGISPDAPRHPIHSHRADEVESLIDAVKSLIVPFIAAADRAGDGLINSKSNDVPSSSTGNVLVHSHPPQELISRLKFALPNHEGRGRDGLLETIQSILNYSVNTWDQGFMDKLYSSTNAVGVVSELLLSVLNTNVHVYQVSPALTIIEKTTGKAFAKLFGFDGPRAGGVTLSGGSASNMSSVVIARNTLYPETKVEGNGSHQFVLFTSAHGHYSVEKAAQACGMGSAAVWTVAVDSAGQMIPSVLQKRVLQARAESKTPLYVNATAGTTVFGSFDPFAAISAICKEERLWMHIDASWGGPLIFSAAHALKFRGTALADSLTVNPHKMMNVPMTCSFLLGPDMAVFHRANTLPAGYLFHGAGDDGEVWDLADLTLACGRRGDSLKLALAWVYYGPAGFERQVDNAYRMATMLTDLVRERPDFVLVSERSPPCLQVCFYYAPGGKPADDAATNTATTREMVARLVRKGYMVDFAPGDRGSFFRVVTNWQTRAETVVRLVEALEELGREGGG